MSELKMLPNVDEVGGRMQIEETRKNEIIELHNSINIHLTKSLENAIRIGQILVEQKKLLRHGEFHRWISDNLPFSDRTVRRYISLYEHRDSLKTDSVSDLTSAYKLIAGDGIPEGNPDLEILRKLWEEYRMDEIPTKEQMNRDRIELKTCTDIKRVKELYDTYFDYEQRATVVGIKIQIHIGLLLKDLEEKKLCQN